MYKNVDLKRGKEESLKRFHPWVFSGAIQQIEGEPEEGEVVRVLTAEGDFIAVGHWQIGSIAVRVLDFEDRDIDEDYWKRRLQVAYDMRRAIGVASGKGNDTYRLVHGEGDGLPGLVVDKFSDVLVVESLALGIDRWKPVILEIVPQPVAPVPVDEKQLKKSRGEVFVTYRIPAVCTVRLMAGMDEIFQSRVPVYQLGTESTFPAGIKTN